MEPSRDSHLLFSNFFFLKKFPRYSLDLWLFSHICNFNTPPKNIVLFVLLIIT